jgi:hypothetical protein
VVVRVRPLENGNVKNIVAVDKNNRTITVQKPNSSNNEPAKVYGFDHVFDQESSQVSVEKFKSFKSPFHIVNYRFSMRLKNKTSVFMLCVTMT